MKKSTLLFFPPRSLPGQEEYSEALNTKEIVFVSGHAGGGKSFLALAHGLKLLLDDKNKIDKICIIRPYIFTNAEDIGALPGTLEEKIGPFVYSVRDNLEILINNRQDVDYILNNKIEFLTLSTLRGRSLHNRFIIVEEAQNVPLEGDGMLTILTRIGQNSRIVIAGDLSQCDIGSRNSAFEEAINVLSDVDEVAYVEMNDIKNIYRNKIIGKIIDAYQRNRQNTI